MLLLGRRTHVCRIKSWTFFADQLVGLGASMGLVSVLWDHPATSFKYVCRVIPILVAILWVCPEWICSVDYLVMVFLPVYPIM